MAETAKDASRHATPMRVNIRYKVYPHGRDALPRDPACHVHKREEMPYPLYTRERPWEKPKTSFETCHAGSRRSASLPCHTLRKRVEMCHAGSRRRPILNATTSPLYARRCTRASSPKMESIHPHSGSNPRLLCLTNVYFGQRTFQSSRDPRSLITSH
jgi:hypothetical protein